MRIRNRLQKLLLTSRSRGFLISFNMDVRYTLIKNFMSESNVFDSKSQNNWNYIRLIAAVAVIYGHSRLLTPGGTSSDFFAAHIAKGITYSGQMAVIVFFFLSGALITKSAIKSVSPYQFAKKRIARIYPGLVVCIAASSILLPIAFGTKFKLTDSFHYFTQNAPGITNEYSIPGLFTSAKNTAVNGSIWTLPNEIRLYFIILLLIILVPKIPVRTFLVLDAILLWFLIIDPAAVPLIGANNTTQGNSLWVINSIFFVIGSLAYLIGFGRLKGWVYFAGSALIYFAWGLHPNHHIWFFLSLIFGVMLISKIKIPTKFKIDSDYSYGTYLYGWPSAQIVNYLFPWTTSVNGFLLSAMLALALATISWHLIEAPSIRYARRRSK